MQCFHPVTAWQTVDGGISFVERGKNLLRQISIRCGRCIGCRLNNANAWAVRCVHEAQMHEFNSFVTLTYDDSHIPLHGSLNYTDFQLFMRRLRKALHNRIRFYMCGEYGENFGRPHYHALLFGCRFPDMVRANSIHSSREIYRSALLERLWNKGMSSIGEVNLATAQYCAKYTMKKIYGDPAKDHYSRLIPETGEIVELMPEFSRMSLKPGIGWSWFQEFGADVWNWDNVVVDGKELPVPRYYDKIISVVNPERSEEIEFERATRALNAKDGPSLEDKEVVAKARVNHFNSRSL